MTAWKKHGLTKKEITKRDYLWQHKKFKRTNAIRLIRKAYLTKNEFSQNNYDSTHYIINEAIYIKIGTINISLFSHHLKFDNGFIPLYRIKSVTVI